MTFGEKIQKLRKSEGWTQEDLAARICISRQALSKWEQGTVVPDTENVLQISKLFDVSTDFLLNDNYELDECTSVFQSSGTRSENSADRINTQCFDNNYNNDKAACNLGKRIVRAVKSGENGRKGAEMKNGTRKNKYFGTDGFRGEANVTLTSMHAYKVGRFLGWYYSSPLSGCTETGYRPRIVIGKDTRRSSYMLEYSIVAGITASGADAYMLHVTTTPSVSYVTRLEEFDCGIMITASHNPFYDNGIKVINRYGEKLDDETTQRIEAYLDGDLDSLGVPEDDLPLAVKEKIGCIVDYASGRNRYVGYLISLASNSYKNLRIGIDAANGASWSIAKAVFGALGAKLTVIGDEPDGLNVNRGCGSTNVETLCALVREKHLDIGFAFDGDADRCLAVDEKGNVVDGDAILYILGKRLKNRGMLNGDTVVATVMSNSGFVASLDKIGIRCEQTTVGDRFVYECMQNNDYSLGGEQSGHIILKKYATTGDGILTAIMLAEEICDTKSTLSALAEPVMLYPQYVKNVRVKDKGMVFDDAGVLGALREVEKSIGGKGRALLRQSGTEPVIRIMIESESEELCKAYAEQIAEAVTRGGHTVE